MRPLHVVAGALALAAPAAAAAQGTVSSQGLGYPPGQLSTMARGSGGALGEFDPGSPLNPAALGAVPATSLFVHYAPESRRVALGGATGDATVIRFPVVGAALTVGQRWVLGLSSSTLVDRTWATSQDVDGTDDGAGLIESYESRGAINDVRLAAAYSFGDRVNAGLGVHALTGSNRLTVTRVDQTGAESSFQQTAELTYSGLAASAGGLWTPARHFTLAASGQVGGSVRAKLGDSTIASATAPARAAGALRYTGISGAALGVRAVWEGWSAIDDMGGPDFTASDGMEIGVGADVAGPRLLGSPLALRVGARWRDLPFSALGEQPTEQAFSAGTGLALGRGRVQLDLALERSRRSAGAARETAWTFGAGVTVRP